MILKDCTHCFKRINNHSFVASGNACRAMIKKLIFLQSPKLMNLYEKYRKTKIVLWPLN